MKYAFCVVNKMNSRLQFRQVVVGTFRGGYVGEMLNIAQTVAKASGGKLAKSTNGVIVEAGESLVAGAAREMFETTDSYELPESVETIAQVEEVVDDMKRARNTFRGW